MHSKTTKNLRRRKLIARKKKRKVNSKSSRYNNLNRELKTWRPTRTNLFRISLRMFYRTWRIRSVFLLLETISWLSMLSVWSKRSRMLMTPIWKITGKLASKNSLPTMSGTHKMLSKMRRLRLANATPRLSGSDFRVDSTRCKSVEDA